MSTPLILFVFLLSTCNVTLAGATEKSTGENPFTAKAALIRYWNSQIQNNLPKPGFLISKASPLSAVESATLVKLAGQNSLSTHYAFFCSSANLFCLSDLSHTLKKHDEDVNFATYVRPNFTNYGTNKAGGQDSFTNYTDFFVPIENFRKYSRGGIGHNDKFTKYAKEETFGNEDFNTYGSSSTGGQSDFKAYADHVVVSALKFTSYSTDSNGKKQEFTSYSKSVSGGDQKFSSYGKNGKAVPNKFTSYGTSTRIMESTFGGYGEQGKDAAGSFSTYGSGGSAIPITKFQSYDDGGNAATEDFTSYSTNATSGHQTFSSYGKKGDNGANKFTSYGNSSNAAESTFSGYGEKGNGALDTFSSYAADTTGPNNNFLNYGDGGNATGQDFTSYRDHANVGDDSFLSYGKNSNAETANFKNYGKSLNIGTDTFRGYGKGSDNHKIGFKEYGANATFKDYAKRGITFAQYRNATSSSGPLTTSAVAEKGKVVNRWVEPGKFFHESMLKAGTIMPMPDIQDKMPKRSFLPRSISSKLPFSTEHVAELKQIFHASENSSMEVIIQDALAECERKPSPGESKQCVGSIEDMIDFAVSVLGHNLIVRSTENVNGSKQDVMIGEVKGINGGKVTKSVSCHQSLFPYLVYYCHSVPKVRLYEAEILDAKSKAKINHGVAICHLDTTSWSANHGAFVALGSSPGLTEVCHWIFENDMTWATSD